MEIRNIAIIAHVDHGKTTLTNALMQQCKMTEKDASMDNDTIEKERGITIYSKNTSVFYKKTKINIVDTPGHADFGSEVERVLRSIDSVILLVDAKEGPMPQTKSVLKKSLALKLKPIVVINKIDKKDARIKEVEEMIYELFLDLGATDEQLNFKTLYSITKQGIAKKTIDDNSKDLTPLLDTILSEVKPASEIEKSSHPVLAQAFNLAYDNFLGRLAICRIYEGKIKTGMLVGYKNQIKEKITKLFTFEGLQKKEIQEAETGDIVMIAGLKDITIGDTIYENEDQEKLPAISIDEPTISLNFLVNDSPLAGNEGKFITNGQLKERLLKELEINVGLKIDFSSKKYYKVFGRGEMHIAILIENMRREGYEFQISKPSVITREENEIMLEPFEEVTIIVNEESSGKIIEKLSKRAGTMTSVSKEKDQSKIIFEIPTRGLLGYKNEFIIDTKGEGMFFSRVLEFRPHIGKIKKNSFGSMVSMTTGKALGFALWNLQERGSLYIPPQTQIYEGMVIGNVSKGVDLTVNPTKGKELTNMRSSSADDSIVLAPPLTLTLERGMSIMKNDEYLEITPTNIRLRKKLLKEVERIKENRKNK